MRIIWEFASYLQIQCLLFLKTYLFLHFFIFYHENQLAKTQKHFCSLKFANQPSKVKTEENQNLLNQEIWSL